MELVAYVPAVLRTLYSHILDTGKETRMTDGYMLEIFVPADKVSELDSNDGALELDPILKQAIEDNQE